MTPLSAALPLRDATAWGGYREAVPLPHRYGACSGELIQFDEARTLFVWADHPVQGIDAVLLNGLPVGDWEARTVTDATGRAMAAVAFGASQDEGVSLVARGRGKQHPRTGQPLINPADVVWDVLTAIAGRDVNDGQLASFRAACDAARLEVAGSIEMRDTVLSVVRSICAAIGATYCPDDPALCRLWPGGGTGPALTIVRDGSVSAACSIADLVNDLTIQFAPEAGQPRGAIQLESPDSIARHGRRPEVIVAPWIGSARVALAVAERLLQQSARPQWTIQATVRRPLRPGQGIQLDHPALPAAGIYTVTERSRDMAAGRTAITLTAPVGGLPAVRLVRQSVAYDPLQYAGAAVATAGTDRLITLLDTDGRPLAGARVSVRELGISGQTDSAGRFIVSVALLPAGAWTLDIVTADGATLEIGIIIQ
ncbi:MAG: carboxypeptidase-like regulatory domain-containing protein [Dokdonella sp.]|nr:carboxypeptidase-like regulatory domain-containing protein [Dokdonella sp.]